MSKCPNKTLQAWKDLSNKYGDLLSYQLYYANNSDIPSLDKAEEYLGKRPELKTKLYLGSVEIDPATKKELLDGLELYFLNSYFKESNSDFDSLFNSKLDNANEFFLKAINNTKAKLKQQKNQNLVNIIDGYEENLIDLLKERLTGYGLNFVQKKKKQSIEPNEDDERPNVSFDDAEETKEEEKASRDTLSVDHAIYYNTKSGFPKAVKLLINSIVNINKEDQLVLSTIGLPTKANLESLLLNTLADVPWNIKSQIEALKKIQENHPSVKKLIEKLGNEDLINGGDISQIPYSKLKLRQEFSQAFGKHKYELLINLLKGNDLIVISSNQESLEKQIETKWASNFNKLIDKYKTNPDEFIKILKNKSKDVNVKTEELASLLGMEFINENVLDPISKDYVPGTNYNASRFITSIIEGIINDYEANRKAFNEGATDTLIKLEDLYKRSGNVSIAIGNITKLINHISKYEMPTDLQLINGEGKVVYSINLHTYQSLITTLLNYPNLEDKEIYLKDQLPHLFNISTQNSIWLNEILNGSNIYTVLIDALGGDNIDKTQHLSDLKENDIMAVVISNLLKDIYPAIKHSDRGMFPGYVINTDIFSTKNKESLPEIMMARKNKSWSGLGVEKFKDIIVGYLWDEYNTAKLSTNLKVDHFDKNKDRSFILDNIKWSLKQYETQDELKKDLSSNITQFVNNYFNQTYSQFEEYGLLQPGYKKIYGKSVLNTEKPFIGIPTDELNKFKDITKNENEIKDAIIGIVAAKYFIGAQEQFKLFLGNPNYYNIKNEDSASKSTIFDISKRANMQSSSKNVTTVDEETNAWVKQSNIFDTLVDPETGENYVYKNGKVDGTFTELVIADDAFFSALDDYFKIIYGEGTSKYKAFKEFTENDGISLVNPFFNREFQHRRGDWSDAKQRTFEKELDIINRVFTSNDEDRRNYELNDIHKIPKEALDQYTTNGVVDYDKIFLEYYSPFVVEKPQYLGPNYGMDIEEYKKLDPSERLGIIAGRKTSYMNLLPSMVKDTVLEDVLMFMLKNGIDTIHFNSAAKFGGLKQTDNNFRTFYNTVTNEQGEVFTNGFNNSDIDPLSIGVLDFRFLGKQQEISGEMKDESTESTQKRKIIQSGIIDNKIPVDYEGTNEEWESLTQDQKKEASPLYKDLRDYIDSQNEIIDLKLQKLLEEFKYSNGTITNPISFINSLIRQARDRKSPDNIIQALENWMSVGGGLKYIETLPNYNKIQNILSSILNNNVIREKRPGTAVPQIPSTGFEKKGTQRRIVDGKIESQNGLGDDAVVKYYTVNEDGTVNPAEIMMPLPTYWIAPLFKYYNNRGANLNDNDIQGLLNLVNRDLANGRLKNLATYTGLRIPNQQLSSTDVLTVKKFFHPSFQSGAVVPSELVVKTGGDFDIDKLNLYFLNLDNEFESVGGENAESIDEILIEDDVDIKIQKLQNFNLKKGQNLLLKYQTARFLSPVDDSSLKVLRDDSTLVSISKSPRNHIFDISELPKQTIRFVGGKGGVGIIATWITFSNISQVHSIEVLPQFINGFDQNDDPIYISTKLDYFGLEGYSLGNVSNNLGQQVEDVLSALLTSQVDIVKDAYAIDLAISTNTLNTICYLCLRGVSIDNIIRFLKEPVIVNYIKERNLNESQLFKNYNLRISKDNLIEQIKRKYPESKSLLDQFINFEESAKRVNDFKAYISADTKTLKDLNEYDSIQELYKKVANLNTIEINNTIQGLTNIIDPKFLKELETNSVIASFLKARSYQNKLYNNLYLTRTNKIKQTLFSIKNMFAYGQLEADKGKIYNKIDEEFINYLIQTRNDLFKDKYEELIKGNNSLAKRLIDLKKSEKFKDNQLIQDLISDLNNDNQDKIKLFRIKLTDIETNQYSSFFDAIKEEDEKLYYDLLVANIFISGLSPGPFQLSKIISYTASQELLKVLSNLNIDSITDKDFSDFISKLPLVRPELLPLRRNKYKKKGIPFNLFVDYDFTNKTNTIKLTNPENSKEVLDISLNKNTNYRQELSKEYLNAIDEFIKFTMNSANFITTKDVIQSEQSDDTDVDTNVTEPTVSTEVKAENISSKGSEFAKKLTNPGNDLTVEYKGKIFRNAEHAYQTWKSGEFDQAAFESKAFKPVGKKAANKATNYQTMVEILTVKLQQHPELIKGINERGGLAYIQQSTHNVTGDKFWESAGQNKFIQALAEAYQLTEPTTPIQPQVSVSTTRKTYSGKITTLKDNQIFVFGSNIGSSKGGAPTHGAGAAKLAKERFGAIQGKPRGIQGKSYGIVTKKYYDVKKSSTPQEIIEEIKGLYEYAKQNPEKEFLVSDYSESNLNGYTGQEMADMFSSAGPIPSNIVFNENFDKLIQTQPVSTVDLSLPIQYTFNIPTKQDLKNNLPLLKNLSKEEVNEVLKYIDHFRTNLTNPSSLSNYYDQDLFTNNIVSENTKSLVKNWFDNYYFKEIGASKEFQNESTNAFRKFQYSLLTDYINFLQKYGWSKDLEKYTGEIPSYVQQTQTVKAVDESVDPITKFKNDLVDLVNQSEIEGGKKVEALNLIKYTKIKTEKDMGALKNKICNML